MTNLQAHFILSPELDERIHFSICLPTLTKSIVYILPICLVKKYYLNVILIYIYLIASALKLFYYIYKNSFTWGT